MQPTRTLALQGGEHVRTVTVELKPSTELLLAIYELSAAFGQLTGAILEHAKAVVEADTRTAWMSDMDQLAGRMAEREGRPVVAPAPPAPASPVAAKAAPQVAAPKVVRAPKQARPNLGPSRLSAALALPREPIDTTTPIVTDMGTIRAKAAMWGLPFDDPTDLDRVNIKAHALGHRPFQIESPRGRVG